MANLIVSTTRINNTNINVYIYKRHSHCGKFIPGPFLKLPFYNIIYVKHVLFINQAF